MAELKDGNHMKIRVLTVFGTRPEAIKLAPVVLELKNEKMFKSYVCVTGQHRHMLDQVLKIFDIKPDFDLNIMRADQTLEDIVSDVMIKIKNVFKKVKPDIVLVQGDTTTAFVVALAAFYNGIKVGHVEAGLRSYDKFKPYPEEINRKLLSHVADFHFTPTRCGADNLIKENIKKNTIFVTGNTVIDALLTIAKRKTQRGKDGEEYEEFKNLDLKKKIILVTAHRRESFGSDMEAMFKAIKKIAVSRPEVEIVYPVHLNPNVRRAVKKILWGVSRVHLVEPMGYEPFVKLMKAAYIVLTDSGGIQEEAPALNKPVLVMRDVTERPDGIRAGCAKLVGTQETGVVSSVIRLLDDQKLYSRMANSKNPYGDGMTAKKIVGVLKRELLKTSNNNHIEIKKKKDEIFQA
jgi:UDP-N-acetylglucosamine 2-epimerase (non-hydrolysing)